MRTTKLRRSILIGLCFVYAWIVYLFLSKKGCRVFDFGALFLVESISHDAGNGFLKQLFFPKVLTLDELRRTVEELNEAQVILNEKRFGPVQEDTVIIAIQVHDRVQYLYHVIRSLSKVGFIDEALLVFSHDVYDDAINLLVRSINFTKVMQIYYPYSIQLHPYEFPGNDPHDCPKVLYGQPVRPDCENAPFYREAKFAQIKHHWWWKANRIFNQLDCTTNHTGMVLFIEDDHYVAPDILYMLLQLNSAAYEMCPQCEVICFGSYARINKSHRYIDKALITTWYTKIYNMGFALNRTTWRRIMEDQDLFCNHNDYNWDITLLFLSQMRKRGPINVMLASEPRVYNFGKCGVHDIRPNANCNASRALFKIDRMVSRAAHLYYPRRIQVNVYSGRRRRGRRYKGGGWKDPRDQELCRNMTRVGRQKKKVKSK